MICGQSEYLCIVIPPKYSSFGDCMNKLVAILSFSSRKNGKCAAISAHISNGFDDCIQVEINRENIPACGSCDYDCLNPELCCPQLTEEYQKLMETLCRSDLEKALKMPCGSKPTTNRRSCI